MMMMVVVARDRSTERRNGNPVAVAVHVDGVDCHADDDDDDVHDVEVAA